MLQEVTEKTVKNEGVRGVFTAFQALLKKLTFSVLKAKLVEIT